jgi:hypothetical protein
MDAVHRHKLVLTGRLAGITRSEANAEAGAAPPAAPPAAPAAQAPASIDSPAIASLLAELTRLVKNVQTDDRRARAAAAQMSVELGVAIAGRLLNTAIAADRQRLDRIVLQILERQKATRPVTVHGHPDDLTLLERQLTANPDAQRCRSLLSLRRDEACPRGQLKLETDEWFCAWDTERSIAELRAALLDETFVDV